jgi:membrane protease YdiL (CAAX protease family)
MLAWAGWYLAARRISSAEAFGLQWPLGGVARLVGVTLLVVGLGLGGEVILSFVGGLLHVKGHWADDLLEDMLWGPTWVAAGVALDSIVWAPFVEEIAFRGILYATLRRKMAVGPAVLVSAVLFAVVHGYSSMGFASVCWSGILWALTYERTRSLLPGMLAHAVNNFLVMGEFVWLVRM